MSIIHCLLKIKFCRNIFLFSLLISTIALSTIYAQESNEITHRSPIILLRKACRWQMIPDRIIWKRYFFDPTFVLYDDGLVIYSKNPDADEWYSVQLTPVEVEELLKGFDIEEFLRLKNFYVVTDDPHLDKDGGIIKYWQGGHVKEVKVWGSWKNAPEVLFKIFKSMTSFNHPNAHLWEPQTVVVDIFPSGRLQGESAWPEDWPDLNDPTSIKGDIKDNYHIFIEGYKRAEVETMYNHLHYKPLLLNNKGWLFAPARYCFPSEELWQDLLGEGRHPVFAPQSEPRKSSLMNDGVKSLTIVLLSAAFGIFITLLIFINR